MPQCKYAFKRGNDDTVRCKLLSENGNCCGNVKFCRVTGHWENRDTWKNCPIKKHHESLGGEKKNGQQV